MSASEQELRCEAIRRRLNGERRKDICQDLERSTRCFDKWWREIRSDPHIEFANQSRAPLNTTSITTPELERLVVAVQRTFESANHSLIGARAIITTAGCRKARSDAARLCQLGTLHHRAAPRSVTEISRDFSGLGG
jgi:hypothetical protein